MRQFLTHVSVSPFRICDKAVLQPVGVINLKLVNLTLVS